MRTSLRRYSLHSTTILQLFQPWETFYSYPNDPSHAAIPTARIIWVTSYSFLLNNRNCCGGNLGAFGQVGGHHPNYPQFAYFSSRGQGEGSRGVTGGAGLAVHDQAGGCTLLANPVVDIGI